jgi:hypothetical protein
LVVGHEEDDDGKDYAEKAGPQFRLPQVKERRPPQESEHLYQSYPPFLVLLLLSY